VSIPLSLYVHIPWCLHKCAYCDFNSHKLTGPLPEAQLLAALERDLIADLPLVEERELCSIFIGGGTPSLLAPEAIERLLKLLGRHCRLARDIEITLEANPGTLEKGRLADFAHAGIRRLSLGVQSFFTQTLKRLDRIHTGPQAEAAVEEALSADFESVNLDLMHGLPGQTFEGATADLERSVGFSPNHISWYQLTIEPNTLFYRYPPELPSDSTLAAIEQAGAKILASAGFVRYEISAYAQANHHSRHNLHYWEFGDYLGIGPGAHSKFTLANAKILRRQKLRQPESYLKAKNYLAKEAEISEQLLSFEYLMNALRLVEGTEDALYEERTGMPIGQLANWRCRNLKRGLLEPGSQLRASELGLRFLDDLLVDFSLKPQ